MGTSIMQKCFSLAGIALLLSGATAFGQYAGEVEGYKEIYPNAHLVRLRQEVNLDISVNRGGIEITQKKLEEDLYLDDSAVHNSHRSVNYSTFFELEKIEASTVLFENNTRREIKVQDYREKDEMDNSFYDDTRSVNFIFPDLKKGARSKLSYSEKIKNPRFLSAFYFGDFSPVINNKLTITAGKDVVLHFKEFNTEGLDIKFSEKERWGKKIYTWELNNVKEYEYERDAPTYRKVLPHIIPVISSYKVNGEIVNVLNEVSDLYSWYYSLVKDLNKGKDDEDLVKLVGELTANKENELEKVRAIYYWAQQNIKYIDFEYALGGFVPREANTVFQKKYGDCKDNSSILQKMLLLAGIEGNLTWIGTRSIPYSYEEVPTPMVDNHMILAYVNKGKTYFLDATGRFIPLELPSSFIQGKEALIAAGDGNFRIEKVPVIPAKQNSLVEESVIKLSGDTIYGSSRAGISGYNKIGFYRSLEREISESKRREFYNARFQKGSNKFLITSLEETNLYDYDRIFSVEYEFTIENHAKKLGKDLYINLNLNRELSNYRTKEDRKNEVEYEYKKYFSYTNKLLIPEGYAVEYLPASEKFHNDLVKSEIRYTLEEGQIIYEHTIELDFLILDLEEQKEVNALIKKADKAYKEIVILKKL